MLIDDRPLTDQPAATKADTKHSAEECQENTRFTDDYRHQVDTRGIAESVQDSEQTGSELSVSEQSVPELSIPGQPQLSSHQQRWLDRGLRFGHILQKVFKARRG